MSIRNFDHKTFAFFIQSSDILSKILELSILQDADIDYPHDDPWIYLCPKSLTKDGLKACIDIRFDQTSDSQHEHEFEENPTDYFCEQVSIYFTDDDLMRDVSFCCDGSIHWITSDQPMNKEIYEKLATDIYMILRNFSVPKDYVIYS